MALLGLLKESWKYFTLVHTKMLHIINSTPVRPIRALNFSTIEVIGVSNQLYSVGVLPV
jgi:hypothetical protein